MKFTQERLQRAQAAREDAWKAMRKTLDVSDGEFDEEAYKAAERKFDEADAELSAVKRGRQIELEEAAGAAGLAGPGGVRFGRPLGEARFADLPGHGYAGSDASADLGRLLVAGQTGDYRSVPDEMRALTEGTLSQGGYMVPTPLASYVLDRARNEMVTAKAGTLIVPFGSETFGVPVQTDDAEPTWREENDAIGEDSITFGKRLFTARSLAVVVKASRELLEDAPQVGDVVGNSLAKAFALKLDYTVLRGTGTAPEPEGILNWPGIDVDALDGVPAWNDLVTAVSLVKAQNYTPTAQIMATRTEADLAVQTGSDGHYLEPPSYLSSVPRYATNQVPTNLGTGTDESELYTGDFRQVALGVRTSLQITPLRERYADTGQVAWIGWARADVVVMQPSAFHVYSGVQTA